MRKLATYWGSVLNRLSPLSLCSASVFCLFYFLLVLSIVLGIFSQIFVLQPFLGQWFFPGFYPADITMCAKNSLIIYWGTPVVFYQLSLRTDLLVLFSDHSILRILSTYVPYIHTRNSARIVPVSAPQRKLGSNSLQQPHFAVLNLARSFQILTKQNNCCILFYIIFQCYKYKLYNSSYNSFIWQFYITVITVI